MTTKRRATRRHFDLAARLAAIFIESRAKRLVRAGAPQMAVFAHDHIGKIILLHGAFEYEELEALSDWLGDRFREKTMLDLGANIGNHSVYLAPQFKQVRAYEPNPRTFELLTVNSKLADNISCCNYGLSSTARRAQMKCRWANIGGASVVSGETRTAPGETVFEIELRTLDASLDADEQIGLIKIDVEDHEYDVIMGARETIARCHPVIVFEQHHNHFKNGSSDVIELIRSLGYSQFAVIEKTPRFDFVLSFLCQLIFGYRLALRPVKTFDRRNYKMVVAIS